MLSHAQDQILCHLRNSAGAGRRIQLVQAALAKLKLIWRRRVPLMQKSDSACSHYYSEQQRHRPLEGLIHGDGFRNEILTVP